MTAPAVAAPTPAYSVGDVISLDLPLAQFTGITTRAALSQLFLEDVATLTAQFVDSVLFHK